MGGPPRHGSRHLPTARAHPQDRRAANRSSAVSALRQTLDRELEQRGYFVGLHRTQRCALEAVHFDVAIASEGSRDAWNEEGRISHAREHLCSAYAAAFRK